MDSAEITEWMAYEQVAGPLGPARLDLQLGILTATVANTARGKGQAAKEAKDFIPEWDQGTAEAADWTQMLTTVKSLNRRLRGTDLTEGGNG